MIQHRGEVFRNVLRQSGYPLKILAGKLGMSKDIIQAKFKERYLCYHFIAKVGELIRYDFSYEYPAIRELKKVTILKIKYD